MAITKSSTVKNTSKGLIKTNKEKIKHFQILKFAQLKNYKMLF